MNVFDKQAKTNKILDAEAEALRAQEVRDFISDVRAAAPKADAAKTSLTALEIKSVLKEQALIISHMSTILRELNSDIERLQKTIEGQINPVKVIS